MLVQLCSRAELMAGGPQQVGTACFVWHGKQSYSCSGANMDAVLNRPLRSRKVPCRAFQ